MRIFPCLLFSLALCACGSQPNIVVTEMSSTTAAVPTASGVPVPYNVGTLQPDTSLTPEDLGAIVLGDAITVPAFQELQLAAVVCRSGTFSATDSFVETVVSSTDQKKAIRLVAFAANGPLRPGTTDTLVMILGRPEHFSGPSAPMYGNGSPNALSCGQPYAELFDIVYADHVVGLTYSTDIHHQDNTIFSVHVYGRLVALAADDPRQPELHHAGRGSSFGGELPISHLDEIVPPERMVTAPAKPTL